jgi:ABC-type lipoprotein release transport system permease subunit
MTTEKALSAINPYTFRLWRERQRRATRALIVTAWLFAIAFGVAFWTIILPRLVIIIRTLFIGLE